MGFLQKFGHNDSSYHRPNDPWVCGRVASGASCQLGPTNRGRCRTEFECQPLLKGKRWHCSRPSTAGGACESGPLPDGTCCNRIGPCRPTRSLRHLRRNVTTAVAGLTLGLLTIVLTGEYALHVIDPGALSIAHSQIDNCESCHEALSHPAGIWGSLFLESSSETNGDSKCLDCHVYSTDVHGMAREQLASMSRNSGAEPPLGTSSLSPGLKLASMFSDDNGSLAVGCSSCHSEHHGIQRSPTDVSNQQCSACHTVKFDSFQGGHPDFHAYPFKRPPTISFGHRSHIDKHFESDDAHENHPGSCLSCHALDEAGKKMALHSYENNCAQCHAEQVAGVGRATSAGITMFSLPGIDAESLVEKGRGIGNWPEYSDEVLTPFMAALLVKDEHSLKVVEAVKNLDLLDLREAGHEELDAAQDFAWLVKEFFFDLKNRGTGFAHRRLVENFGGDQDLGAYNAALAHLSPATVSKLLTDWFPNIERELADVNSGQQPSDLLDVAAEADAMGLPSARGDTSEVQPSSGGEEEKTGENNGEIILSDGDTIIFDEDGEINFDDDAIIFDEDGEINFDDDAIIFDDGDEISFEDDDAIDFDDEEGINLGNSSELGFDKESRETVAATGRPEIVYGGEEWVATGGWYLEDFTLMYRPAAHADELITTWLQLAVLSENDRVGQEIFTLLSQRDSPGACMKCHTAGVAADGVRTVNWSFQRREIENGFTKFSHKAHVFSMGDGGCVRCHVLADDQGSSAGPDNLLPTNHPGDFSNLNIQSCLQCHTDDYAGDDCTQCHTYHAGEAKSSRLEGEVKVRSLRQPETIGGVLVTPKN